MRVLVVAALLGAPPAHADVIVDADLALGVAYEPGEEFGRRSSGFAMGLGVGGAVTPRLTLQGRLRAGRFSQLSYSSWFPLALGPSATLALGPVWVSGGVSIALVLNNRSHCFRHPDGLGGDVALGIGVPISNRVALTLTNAVTVIDTGGERHTDVQVMGGVRVALAAPTRVQPGR